MSFVQRPLADETRLVARSSGLVPSDKQWLVYLFPGAGDYHAIVDIHGYNGDRLDFLVKMVAG